MQFELDGETLRVKRPKVDGLFIMRKIARNLLPARGVITDGAVHSGTWQVSTRRRLVTR